MKNVLLSFLFCGLSAAASEQSLLENLGNDKLNETQRNNACFELRGAKSAAAVAAMRAVLHNPKLRSCVGTNLRLAGAVDVLKEALTDESPELRALAARELGAFEKPELLELLAAAARDENLLVSANAVEGLTRYRDRGVMPYLLDIAKGGGISGTLALNRALQLGGDPRILATARQLLQSKELADRLEGIRVIGDIGDASDCPALEKIALDTEEYSSKGRGFGLMPAISLSRAAKTALASIQSRTATRPATAGS